MSGAREGESHTIAYPLCPRCKERHGPYARCSPQPPFNPWPYYSWMPPAPSNKDQREEGR